MERNTYFFFLVLAVLGLGCCAGFFKLWRVGATPSCGAQAIVVASLVADMGSRGVGISSSGFWALEHSFNSCTQAELLCGIWELYRPGVRPGVKPVSPAGRWILYR